MLSRTSSKKALRPRGHVEIPMARHFRGEDEEILRETQGKPPKVKPVEKLGAFLYRLGEFETVVIGVEETRLFNKENVLAVRYRLPKAYSYTPESAEIRIRDNHEQRIEVIRAITNAESHGPDSKLTTVSFIPGGVNYMEHGKQLLEECWENELAEFCATLDRNPNLRHVHIAAELCERVGFRLAVETLLNNSSLVELSLPNLSRQGWRDLALALAWNDTLQVLTLRWNAEGMKTFRQTPVATSKGVVTWTECNTALETLCISCPRDFRLGVDATACAATLHQVSCVPKFVIEYSPPDPAPRLLGFARNLRIALQKAPNVRELHLLVPFQGPELSELILKLPMLPGVVLVRDLWRKADLKAVCTMIDQSETLRFLGIRHQNPKKKLGLLKYLEWITKEDIVNFLAVVGKSRLEALSLCGWGLVDGESVSKALESLQRNRPQLKIDLTGTGLDLKDMLQPYYAILQKQKAAEMYRGFRLAIERPPSRSRSPSLHLVSPPASQAGRSGIMESSGASSSSGSALFEKSSTIAEHLEEIALGSGSVDLAVKQQPQQQEQQQPQQQPQQQHQQPQQQLQQQHQQQQPHHLPQKPQRPRLRHCDSMLIRSFKCDQIVEATGKFQTLLGQGAFGEVYEGELGTEGGGNSRKIAVKVLKLEGVHIGTGERQRIEKSFETEVVTLGQVRHVNLVKLLGFCEHQQRGRMLVYEFMPNSSLDRWIYGNDPRRARLAWETRKRLSIGIARGLEYLHTGCSPPIVHLDIKPQNILLDAKFTPKLADFGIAKLVDMEENLARMTVARGTLFYMAPEMYDCRHVTPKSDVYSFGILLVELVTGRKNVDWTLEADDPRRFFPAWAREKFQGGLWMDVYRELQAPLLAPSIPGFQANEARRLLCIAIECIHEQMDQRPDMQTVVHMLEGRVDVRDPSGRRSGYHNDYSF